jgi:hypothetical protein|tara:strand:+ start:577 stop:828 length:252 start_codon:yes stop_codon:yes gene_type:complete
MNIKIGSWLLIDNGLGAPTLVYLKSDDSATLGKGWFSGWFYNSNFGLECADWATFNRKDYKDVYILSEFEVNSLPTAFTEAVA